MAPKRDTRTEDGIETLGPQVISSRPQSGNRPNEPTGQAESLWGRLSMSQMGGRAQRERPPSALSSHRPPTGPVIGAVDGWKRKDKTILDAANELAGTYYRPKTKETAQAWEYLLTLVMGFIGGDVPRDVLASATDDCLVILKDESIKELERKERLEAVLFNSRNSSISTDQFAQFVNLSKRIVDYSSPSNAASAKPMGSVLDDEDDVAVVFEEDEDNQDGPGAMSNVIVEDEEQDEVSMAEIIKGSLSMEEESSVLFGQKETIADQEDGLEEETNAVDLELLAFPQGNYPEYYLLESNN